MITTAEDREVEAIGALLEGRDWVRGGEVAQALEEASGPYLHKPLKRVRIILTGLGYRRAYRLAARTPVWIAPHIPRRCQRRRTLQTHDLERLIALVAGRDVLTATEIAAAVDVRRPGGGLYKGALAYLHELGFQRTRTMNGTRRWVYVRGRRRRGHATDRS
jgi:hypothetical protein